MMDAIEYFTLNVVQSHLFQQLDYIKSTVSNGADKQRLADPFHKVEY